MFNSTHTHAGLALARTGLDRWAPYASWTAVIASNLPDIDIVAQLAGTGTYLEYHRGITHSIFGLPVLSFLLAAVMNEISEFRGRPAGPMWKHFAVAFIAMSTHIMLDWTNSYGVRPFLPFDATWYYGDTLFIIDPYLDLILLVGILVGRSRVHRRRTAASLAVIAAIAYIGGRMELRGAARQQLSQYNKEVPGVVSAAVEPQPLNPLAWTGFLETETYSSRIGTNLSTGKAVVALRIPKPLSSVVLEAAEATHSARTFLGFARFPVTRIEASGSGYRVLFIDLRFVRQGAPTSVGLAAEIILDGALQVIDQSISFTQTLK